MKKHDGSANHPEAEKGGCRQSYLIHLKCAREVAIYENKTERVDLLITSEHEVYTGIEIKAWGVGRVGPRQGHLLGTQTNKDVLDELNAGIEKLAGSKQVHVRLMLVVVPVIDDQFKPVIDAFTPYEPTYIKVAESFAVCVWLKLQGIDLIDSLGARAC